jgi:hypothetical protein
VNDTYLRGVEGDTAVGRKREALNAISSTSYMTSVHGCSVANIIHTTLFSTGTVNFIEKIL